MPNQRIQYGGPTVFEGTFRGDDEVSGLNTVVHHQAHAAPAAGGHNVQLDADDILGTIKTTYDHGQERIFEAHRSNDDSVTFLIDENADMTVRSVVVETDAIVNAKVQTETLECLGGLEAGVWEETQSLFHAIQVKEDLDANTVHVERGITSGTVETQVLQSAIIQVNAVFGEAFSPWDPYDRDALPTVVMRDPQSGIVQIANLRVTARKNDLNQDQHVRHDNVPAGLFFPEGTCSEVLQLIQDARIVFHPALNTYYRFGAVHGAVSGTSHIDEDGLHFSSGTGNDLNSVRLRVSRDHPTLVLTGSKNSVNIAGTLIEHSSLQVQNAAGQPTFSVNSSGSAVAASFFSNGQMRSDGGLRLHDPGNALGTVLTVTDDAQEPRIIMKSNGEIEASGYIQIIQPGAGSYDCSLNADGSIDCADISCLDIQSSALQCSSITTPLVDLRSAADPGAGNRVSLMNARNHDNEIRATVYDNGEIVCRQLEIQAALAGDDQPLLVGKNNAGDETFTLYSDGHMTFRHQFQALAGIPAAVHSSVIAGDNSVYIGSARYSYDRVNHEVALSTLKQGHIPVYLQGRGFTANDLPAAHAESDMSVRKWLVHAREHFDEQELDVTDVFPTANADWDVADAPTPALKADVVALQAFVTGADADITTLETEMDQAQADIVALQGASSGLGSAATIENTNGDASLTLTSAGQSPESFIRFTVDDQTNADQDRDWLVAGTDFDNHGELLLGQTVWSGTTETAMRCFIDGNIGIQTNNSVNRGCAFGKTVLFKEKCDFWGELDASHYNSNATFGTGQVTAGSFIVSGTSVLPTLVSHAVSIGTNAGGVAANVTAIAANTSASAANTTAVAALAAPTLIVWDLSNKPADGYQLPDGNLKIIVGNGSSGQSAQTYRVKLPASPSVGDSVEVCALANIHFELPNGSATQWAAVYDDVNYVKKIKYNCPTHRHGIITYTLTPNSGGTVFRWLSTNGILEA